MLETVHPGSWVGDTVEEFKKLPTWGKIIVGLVVLAVVVYGIHAYSSRNNTINNATSTSPSIGAKTSGGMLSASNYPQDSNAPIPYQPINPPVSQTVPTVTTPAKPTLFNVLVRGLWPGQQAGPSGGGVPIFDAPNVTFDQTGNPTNTVGGEPLNTAIQVGNSVQGNYAGKPAVYYPVTVNGKRGYIGSWDLGNTPPVQSTAPPNSTPAGQGSSGGPGDRFHIVQYGENMSHVARAYGLKSWRDFGVNEFWHGQKVRVPA